MYIDIYGEYAWLVPLKDKKGVKVTNAFQIILEEWTSKKHKTNKIWVDKVN